MASGNPNPGFWYDLLGHPLAAWDGHPECRLCLHAKASEGDILFTEYPLLDLSVLVPASMEGVRGHRRGYGDNVSPLTKHWTATSL